MFPWIAAEIGLDVEYCTGCVELSGFCVINVIELSVSCFN